MIHGKKNVKIRELTSIYLCFNCGKVKKKEKKVKAIKNSNGRCKKTTRNLFFQRTLQIQQLIVENNNNNDNYNNNSAANN